MTTTLLDTFPLLRQRLCAEAGLDSEGHEPPVETGAWLATLGTDGTWADVRYVDDELKDWAPAVHLARLRALARAWYLGKAVDFDALCRGLEGWYARNPQSENWWWNMIGAPLLLGETLLYLKDVLDPSYITRAVPAFTCHEPIGRFTGQNLVWTATVALYHGLLTDDPARVEGAYTHIRKEVRVLPGEEGIQPDWSFFQHGLLLYSGGYGQGFANDVGRLIAVAAGTPFAWPEALVARFAAFLLDGSRWMVRGRTFDPGACGREISRQGHSTARYAAGLRALASFDHPRRAETNELPDGNRHFWCADLMVQQRPAYYVSVHTASPRVYNADWPCCGGEGRLCHHMAEGATILLRDGDEYRDIYPVWNWRQVPGTTVAQAAGVLDIETVRDFGANPFSGGASDGRVGCAAMDFRRGTLTARTAWFLFDNTLVALGAGITDSSGDLVRTTINQCHWRGPAAMDGQALDAGDYPLQPGSTFTHDGFSYRLLDGAGSLRLGTQSGAWSDCGVGSSEQLTLPVLNAGIDHGRHPANARYAYVVSPSGADESVTVLHNDPALQAVWSTTAERGHAVCYAPGSLVFPDGQQVRVDTPCILLYRREAGRAILTLADPTQQQARVTVTLSGPVTATVDLQLPVREYAGSSVTVGIG
jgi:chondroitin AC lyase